MALEGGEPPLDEAEILAREVAEDAKAAEAYATAADPEVGEPPRGGLSMPTLVLIGLVIALVFFLAGIEVQKLLG